MKFLHIDTNLQKLKVERKFFEWAWSKTCGQSDHGTLKLTAYQE